MLCIVVQIISIILMSVPIIKNDMTGTLYIIADSLISHHTEILTLTTDTIIHKVYNIPAMTSFKWTDYLKPSIDLLIALVGAFVLIWKYLTQKRKESEERIIESKRNAYSEFLKDFTESAIRISYDKEVGGIKDDRRRINARNLLLLYGNDKVIKAYNDWVELNDKDQANHGTDKDVELFGKILIEIRKDIHGTSKVTEKEIKNLNPFYRG
jgi:hypothetical protein